jgi:glycosyltransferase involved in cell wall biosynthesis
MKITILSTFDNFGGASIAASRLNKALNNNALSSNMLVQTQRSSFTHVHSFPQNWFQKKLAFLRFAFDRFQFFFYEKSKKVRFIFSQATIGVDISTHDLILKSDVVHLHWINFGFLSLDSIDKLIKTQKPIVWTLHDMWAFTGGCHYARECTNYESSCGNCTQFLKKPTEKDLSKRVWQAKYSIYQQANFTIVACSEWLAQKARESSLLQGRNIITIPNPIDIQTFKPTDKVTARQYFKLSPNKKYVLFGAVKIADERKGFSYFAEAMTVISYQLSINQKDSSEIEIIVFGQAEASDFESLPFKVNVLGRLSDVETITKAYSAATVFVSPSLEDNLPNTIMESMACGTPVVGFEVGGIPEMIEHEQCGYLAKYKSAEDLANGIYWILYQSDYQSLCHNSRTKVVENYSEKVVAEKYRKVYESMS